MLLLRNTRVNSSSGAGSRSPIFTPAVTPGPGAVFLVNGAYGMDSCQDMDDLVGDLVSYADSTGSYVIGFYLGGATASAVPCYIPDPPSEDSWLVEMTCSNWNFQPIWDDLQAPCNSGMSHLISMNTGTAASQGTAAANAASSALARVVYRTP